MKRRQDETNARPVARPTATQPDGSQAQGGEGVRPASQDAIAGRAYELYLERGAEPGHDIEDWFRAEVELREGR